MRCRNCNVDLPDTYTVCPLCSGKASPDEALIGGLRLAEFPDVKTEPYKRDPFPIFMGIWLAVSLISLLLFKLQVITQPILAAVVCLVPLVWTLIGRPLMVKQPYAGNFAMMNVYPLTLACLWFGKIHFGDYKTPFASFVPFCFIAVLVALAVIMLVDIRHEPSEDDFQFFYLIHLFHFFQLVVLEKLFLLFLLKFHLDFDIQKCSHYRVLLLLFYLRLHLLLHQLLFHLVFKQEKRRLRKEKH